MMSLSFRGRALAPLGAVLLGLMVGTPAQASDAGEIAQACIERIGDRVERASEQIRTVRTRTIGVIRELDDAGAPDAAIIHAGQEGKDAINRRASDAMQDVTRIARRCIEELESIEAPPALIRRVHRAAHGGRMAIRMMRNRALMQVNGAVRHALDG